MKTKRGQCSNYKYAVSIRKKQERDRLDGKPCRDCEKVPFKSNVHGQKWRT